MSPIDDPEGSNRVLDMLRRPSSLLRRGLMPTVGIARYQLADFHLGLMLENLNFKFNTCQCKPSSSRHIASSIA
jgi:hypothetical protein